MIVFIVSLHPITCKFNPTGLALIRPSLLLRVQQQIACLVLKLLYKSWDAPDMKTEHAATLLSLHTFFTLVNLAPPFLFVPYLQNTWFNINLVAGKTSENKTYSYILKIYESKKQACVNLQASSLLWCCLFRGYSLLSSGFAFEIWRSLASLNSEPKFYFLHYPCSRHYFLFNQDFYMRRICFSSSHHQKFSSGQ